MENDTNKEPYLTGYEASQIWMRLTELMSQRENRGTNDIVSDYLSASERELYEALTKRFTYETNLIEHCESATSLDGEDFPYIINKIEGYKEDNGNSRELGKTFIDNILNKIKPHTITVGEYMRLHNAQIRDEMEKETIRKEGLKDGNHY